MKLLASAKESCTISIPAVLLALMISSCDPGLLSQGDGGKPVALLYAVTWYFPAYDGDPSYNPNLAGPANDLDSLATLMPARGWTVIARKDDAATLAQLNADVTALTPTVKPGQRVFFYWSGHGLQDPGVVAAGEYLGLYGVVKPYPASTTSYSLDGSAMVSAGQLATIFQPLLAKGANLIMVLDSCYSGGFVSDRGFTNALPDNFSTDPKMGDALDSGTVFSRALDGYLRSSTPAGTGLASDGVWVLSAAGKNEVSWDDASSNPTHGFFSWQFIQSGTADNTGRLHADYNYDGQVSLMESYRYCQAQMDLKRNNQVIAHQIYDFQFKAHLTGNPLDILLF